MRKVLISPYQLSRTANLRVGKSTSNLNGILILYNDNNHKYAELSQKKNELENQLFTAIGVSQDESEKKILLSLKRDIYNDRYKQIINNQKYSVFLNEYYIKISELIDLNKSIVDNMEKIKNIWDSQKLLDTKQLQWELSKNIPFKNGLVMVGDRNLFKNIEKYQCTESSILNKKMRNTELAVQNYFNRMVMKPSPFSTFTTINIKVNDCELYRANQKFEDKIYQCQLNELFLKVLQILIIQLEDSKQCFIKLNPTTNRNDFEETFSFVYVDTSNISYLFYKENLRTIKENKFIKLLYELLNVRKYKFEHLVEVMNQELSIDSCKIENYIRKLLSFGFIESDINIDEQSTKKIKDIANFLENNYYSKYEDVIKLLFEIDSTISVISSLSLSEYVEKQNLISKVYNLCEKVMMFFSRSMREINITTKNIIYENNIYPFLDSSIEKLTQCQIKRFTLASYLYRLFDDNILEKTMYFELFEKMYKSNDKIRAIDFFNVFLSHDNSNDWKKLQNTSIIQDIKELRIEFFNYLDHLLNQTGANVDSIVISEKWLSEFIKKFPQQLRLPRSYSFYYQKDESQRIVINNVGPGYGRHFLRYVSELKKEDKELFLNIYKDHMKNIESSLNKENIDIGAMLGLNINVHPFVSKVFTYPCSEIHSAESIDLKNLFVGVDRENKRLILIDNKENEINANPLGFLFPMLAPKLYRFYCLFSNSDGIELSFWDRYHSYFALKKMNSYPSICIGDSSLMIERETFKVFFSNDEYDNFSSDTYIALKEKLKKFSTNNISHIFAKKITDIDALLGDEIVVEDWIDSIKNGKLRKPQYYSLENTIDLKNFVNIVKQGEEEITIQPVFPNTEKIVEYLVELTECE